ncbi:hypothetical protein L6164_029162 [Bauhinia variegata]|uniref:Uncharacterized protein n=1 Tax=Bauhinia variegata TaxID=167791 RepID=A0ACB9L8V9_BAUVA|nr:hypothetical protein L6164_029162 [Bauhinia variegata]
MAAATCCKFVAFATFLLLAASSSGGVSAPVAAPPLTAASPGPAGGNDCFTALVGLSDCLTYVEEGSNLTKPDKGCCPALSKLINTNPICLCQLLGNPNATSSLGVKIDLNRALKLPSVCKVETPPVSTCSAVGVPVSLPMTPSMSPSGEPVNGPATSPSSGGATASPPSSIAALSIQVSVLPFTFGLATAFVFVFF